MDRFRALIEALEADGELLSVSQTVDARFELGELLKQAEARGKAVRFESVKGSDFPVVAGLLTSMDRFAQGLGLPGTGGFTQAKHAEMVKQAIEVPLAFTDVASAACKHTVLSGDAASCEHLPVPTFFARDTGPFMTAAVGISRNPENGIINAGFYRVLVLGSDQLAISVSPNSDLYAFLQADAQAKRATRVALVIGMEPALIMAAAAKVPADISELDVAGALQGTPLETVRAECSELPVPANAEFVVEIIIEHKETIPNTMGEFGNLYGEQAAHIATVEAITHRQNPVFHVIRAGAGKEHNQIGRIVFCGVEKALAEELRSVYPGVKDVRVVFDPPRQGMLGDVYIRFERGFEFDADKLIRTTFNTRCGRFLLLQIIRRIVLLDTDIDLSDDLEVEWAMATRATQSSDYMSFELPEVPNGSVRLGVDARADDPKKLEIVTTPGASEFELDDYL